MVFALKEGQGIPLEMGDRAGTQGEPLPRAWFTGGEDWNGANPRTRKERAGQGADSLPGTERAGTEGNAWGSPERAVPNRTRKGEGRGQNCRKEGTGTRKGEREGPPCRANGKGFPKGSKTGHHPGVSCKATPRDRGKYAPGGGMPGYV